MIPKHVTRIAGAGVIVGLIALAWYLAGPGPMDFARDEKVALAGYSKTVTGAPADLPDSDPLARGKYLTEAADCEACHTTDGGERFAGGRVFETSFGIIYSPNITPDPETGIGRWSDADFLKALHEGIRRNGERLYPAFPYAAYTYLTDQDALAIKAYLASVPAVKNTAPANTLRFPYNQRWLMSIWSALYNPDKRFEPVAARSATWNRGAYLSEALGHCGDCHTPRTLLQSLDNRRKFAGGAAEGWRAYNLTSDTASGIGAWSRSSVEQYLRTGHTMDRGSAFGPMAQAVHLSLQKLTASDVSAIVDYVQSVPPISTPDLPAPRMTPASTNPAEERANAPDPGGRLIFASVCAGCHSWTGINSYVPHSTLTGTRAVNDPTATNVALAVLRGASTLPPSGDIAVMPPFAAALSDADIASVANYVITRFGASPSAISTSEVRRLRELR
jgi:mono/diheme cytochrome c family protein